jgi:putative zinc finger/helix-turn-helix YgiT family protein
MTESTECLPEGLCPSCFEGMIHDRSCDHAATLPNGREILIKDVPCSLCDHCGARFFSPQASDQIEAAFLKAANSLSPADVVQLVEMTGLAEDKLCERLGLGAKTIYRWRRGAQRPSKSLSMLLAIVARHPALFEWLERDGWKEGPLESLTRHISSTRTISDRDSRRRLATPRLDRHRLAESQPTQDKATIDQTTFSRTGGGGRDRNTISDFFQLAGING